MTEKIRTRDPKDELHYTTKCRFFTGIQHDVCKAGIRYDSFQPTGIPYQRIPCVYPSSPNTCGSISRYTKEESKTMVADDNVRIDRMLAEMRAGLCQTCKKAVEGVRQVGRCVYATNCGHRLGQGKATQMSEFRVARAKAYNRGYRVEKETDRGGVATFTLVSPDGRRIYIMRDRREEFAENHCWAQVPKEEE